VLVVTLRCAIPLAVATALLATIPAAAAPAANRSVRMNELQVIGTHNSYKREITEREQAAYDAAVQKPGDYDQFLAYSHAPLQQQFTGQGCAGWSSTCSRTRRAASTTSR